MCMYKNEFWLLEGLHVPCYINLSFVGWCLPRGYRLWCQWGDEVQGTVYRESSEGSSHRWPQEGTKVGSFNSLISVMVWQQISHRSNNSRDFVSETWNSQWRDCYSSWIWCTSILIWAKGTCSSFWVIVSALMGSWRLFRIHSWYDILLEDNFLGWCHGKLKLTCLHPKNVHFKCLTFYLEPMMHVLCTKLRSLMMVGSYALRTFF